MADDLNQLAFEFVIGTLRGGERRRFAQQLAKNVALMQQVNFWEEHLMALPEPAHLPPAQNTWARIAAQLTPDLETTTAPRRDIVSRLSAWLFPSAVASFCTLMIVFAVLQFSAAPSSEYVAVLSDNQGRPALTAITQGDNAQMRLQWLPVSVAADKNLQLWAISKRDGQARSLAVFTAAQGKVLPLDVPQLRLIKDADSLILTEEDIGGSAMDEPSSVVVAKGICVRFAAQ